MPETPGAYIHFPFCRTACTYCDFYRLTGAGEAGRREFLDALHREIAGCGVQVPEPDRRLDTVFVGGGTPSLLTPAQVEALFGRLAEVFVLEPDLEATIEINPEVPLEWLAAYRRSGFNRISIGLQSLDDAVLTAAGRRHDAGRGLECFRAARAAGFDDINVDLIAGLPGQDPRRWPAELNTLIALGPDHVSIYLLETDKQTDLVRAARDGRVRLLSDETHARMYHQARVTLLRSGYRHYEISNFCRPGRPSRHNLKYWTDRPFLGFGPGAHGYLHRVRYSHPADLRSYLRRPVPELPRPHRLDDRERRARAEEAAMNGLRLLEGIDLEAIESRYRIPLSRQCRPALDSVIAAGLVREQNGRWRLTERGLLLSNEVFRAFLSDPPAGPDHPPARLTPRNLLQ